MEEELGKEKFVVEFIEKVDVSPSEEKGTYEKKETREKAIKSYRKYPCYENCTDVIFPNEKEQNEEEQNKPIKLTGDILTSIKVPLDTCLNITGNPKIASGNGPVIRRFIIDGFNDDYYNMLPYYKAFALVYYWIGNMMPVIWNFRAGPADTWMYKLNNIKAWYAEEVQKVSEESDLEKRLNEAVRNGNKSKQEDMYRLWIQWMIVTEKNKTFDDFIKNNFLEDMESQYDENKLKIPRDASCDEIKDFWIKNTKYIIQRSYRIRYKKNGELEKTDQTNIEAVFKKIFGQAGFKVSTEKTIGELCRCEGLLK